jgi:zinc protease
MKNISSLSVQFFTFVILFSIGIHAGGVKKYEEGKIYKHQLKNGLTILTMERHIAPLIYHQLTYRVGSRNEQLGITGISHVVEHLMFKGTKKYGKGEASKTISANSGIFNAFTANDMTSYYEYLPANKIDVALDIESDRMQNATFDPEEFKSEIEVIIQERRMRSESGASGIMREVFNSLVFTSHPNRDPIIGWPTDLRNMTRDEAYTYYKKYYTPNNAFLVLIGDFETDEMVKKVEKYYGKIPKGPEVKDVNVHQEKQNVRKTLTLRHADNSESSMRMAFVVPTYENEDAPALRVGGMILCEKSRDARLFKKLVERHQISSSVAGGFGMTKDPTFFSISTTAKPDSSLDKIEQLIWDEIKVMQTEPVTDHELQKVKNRYKFNQVTSYIKNADIGSRISRYETFFGWDFQKEFDNRINSVTKEDIIRVFNKYFTDEQVSIAYSLPKEGVKKGKKVNTGEEGEGTPDSEDYNFQDQDKFYFQPPIEALEIINNLEPVYVEEDIIKPKPIAHLIKTMRLKNGVKIHTIENHLVPTVSVVGMIETGYIPENLEGRQPGIANFLTDLMNRGSQKMNYTELSERMAFVPFTFAVSGSYRGFYFQGNSLIEDADEMFKTGYDLVTLPAMLDEEMSKLKPRHINGAKNRFKKTGIKAFYEMFNTLMGDHPITKYNSTEESIKSITKDDLINLHKKYFKPENLTILMIGDMTPEQMRDLADKYFGEWKNDSPAFEIIQTPKIKELNDKIVKVFPEKEYKECTINIGFAPTNDVLLNEAEALAVMNYILASSALTSRMGIELRDKQGLIYGIKSELWSTSDNFGYWKFNTKTGPDNTQKVIKGIFSEIKKFFENGITDEELITAKNRQLGLLPFHVETPDDVAQIVFDSIKENKPFDYFDKKADRIKAVTKEDVMRVAKKYLTTDKFMIVVDGPIEKNALDNLISEL